MDRRIAGQGERCVLAIDAQGHFGEVIRTDATHCYLLMPDGRESFCSKAELSEGKMRATPALKVIKPDGTWVYIGEAPKCQRNPNGTAVFSREGVFV